MTTLTSYLTFSGNCREAMTFYKQCLDGELSFQTIGESPMAGKMPLKMKDSILHATLKKDNVVLLASDMVSHTGLIKGNAVSLMLNCSTEDELKKCFEKLSRGGEQTFPIEVTHWGALFGGLSDKYGNHWLLHYQKQ